MRILPTILCLLALPLTVRGFERPAPGPGITVIEYTGFTVGYDSVNRLPAWVAYELTADECRSDVARRNGKTFRQDPDIGLPQADDNDYRNSGWTRGHMAPAADFKWSGQAMSETFYFTNCCPQTEYLNSRSWERLETRVREWALEFDTVWVVTGPIIGDHEFGYLGDNRIPIPDAFFKALAARDSTGSYRTVAFVLHNISTAQPYPQCSMSVAALEETLGVELFPGVTGKDSVEGRFWGM